MSMKRKGKRASAPPKPATRPSRSKTKLPVPAHTVPDWDNTLQARMRKFFPGTTSVLGKAFVDFVSRVIEGRGPDGDRVNPDIGVRMCVNIAAVHVGAFCRSSLAGDKAAYLNAYDLARVPNGKPVSDQRKKVDAALPLPTGHTAEKTYFGAVELTGCGIRFYGDVCLILRADSVPRDTVVLDRNSYDLLRLPLSERVAQLARRHRRAAGASNLEKAMKTVARELSGSWSQDIAALGAVKIADSQLPRERRLSAGLIAQGILEDEDYIEVLRQGSFSAAELQEVRLCGIEAGAEAQIGDRLRYGPTPTHAELLWRYQRRRAVRALRDCGVPTRVVTTLGRTRG
jgi:hypothetical protein